MEKKEINESTNFSNSETIVLQIHSKIKVANIEKGTKKAPRTKALVFIPNLEKSQPINCPLNYFQDNVSLTEKWYINDFDQKVPLTSINNLKKVLITIKTNDKEEKVKIPMSISERLLDYFKLGVSLNPEKYEGFDCHKFISLLANVNFNIENPDFNYVEEKPDIGDFVVLTNRRILPKSIQHWALYLGDNQYISKFGKSGEGADCFVHIVTLEAMNYFYDCEFLYVATPKENAEPFGND